MKDKKRTVYGVIVSFEPVGAPKLKALLRLEMEDTDETAESLRYLIEEHQCPENIFSMVREIWAEGPDPHGIVKIKSVIPWDPTYDARQGGDNTAEEWPNPMFKAVEDLDAKEFPCTWCGETSSPHAHFCQRE
jgi:hypothetical protein